jgi:GntR family transcriptional regulator
MTYRQIAEDLTRRIEAGEYASTGGKLPSYKELADLYSVSVASIQRAIGLLNDRGTTVGVSGVGVWAADKPQER